jgi:hypothetical protein
LEARGWPISIPVTAAISGGLGVLLIVRHGGLSRKSLSKGDLDIVEGVYEEMANFAAMSEDDGFLGQCAGEVLELASPAAQSSAVYKSPGESHGPKQLQLLLIPRPTPERNL